MVSAKLRAKVLRLAHESKEGHIGSSLSAIDLVDCIYTKFEVGSEIDDTLFVLSKGDQ
jgi:transketolase N-terminal domain/subunit